jgi:hypothetical protein
MTDPAPDAEPSGGTIAIQWEPASQEAPRRPKALVIIAVLSLAGYGVLLGAGDLGEQLPLFLGLSGLLAVLYLVALILARRSEPTSGALGVVLAAALLFRVIMLFAQPTLSDDIHRYVRDGWVQVNGVNPYVHAPDDPSLEALRLPDHDRINNPSIPTIYPPLAQVLFAISAFVSPTPFALKAALVLLDAGTILIMLFWVRTLGRNPLSIIVYAWHPLAVIEGACSGHVDVLGSFFLVLSASLIIGSRRFASSAALAASVLSKVLPLLLIPLLGRRFKNRHLLFLVAILVVVTGPYLAGAGMQMFAGLSEYGQRWEFNAAPYLLVREGIELLHPTEALKSGLDRVKRGLRDPVFLEPVYEWLYPPYLARAILLMGLVAVLVWIALQSMSVEREVILGLGAILLLSPTLHPWYLLWILPFLTLWTSPAWIWLSLTIPLSYLALDRADGSVPVWVLIVEYAPMVLLGLLAWWRQSRGPERRWGP